MRIGIDFTSAVRGRAGIGRYTRELIRALARRDHANAYVLFVPRDARSELLRYDWPSNFSIRRAPLTERTLAALWHRARAPLPVEAFIGKVDVFYSPDFLLPPTSSVAAHCGSCSACIDVCPTRAIVAPYRLDARRCISYLTIEHEGPIPLELRAAMGNRIYGCDDCQLVCPWNKYAARARLPDFDARERLAHPTLLQLWGWSETDFLHHTEGSAIRRIGHTRWQRNLAVALGNAWRATGDAAIVQALRAQRDGAAPLVREHIEWALEQGPPAGQAGATAPVP